MNPKQKRPREDDRSLKCRHCGCRHFYVIYMRRAARGQTRATPAVPPSKDFEGYYRFLCPGCGELRCTVNPRTNLAHCFCCGRNVNNIDLLMSLDYDFLAAVELLEQWLRSHLRRHAKSTA